MYHIRLRGTHREIGGKLGRALLTSGKDFYSITALDEFQENFGSESQKILFSIFPEVREEIEGAAEAMQFPAARLASWLMTVGCCYDFRGCTAFAFRKGDKICYGRNSDLPPALKKVSCSALYQPADGGNAFLLNTSAVINGEEGINRYGLACAMTFVAPDTGRIQPGLNSMFIVRYLLEKAADVAEALHLLKSLPVASSCNILLADASGALAACECSCERLLINNNNEFVYITNEFLSDTMRPYASLCNSAFYSKERTATCRYAFGVPFENTENAVPFAEDLLSGKYGFMCNYPKEGNFDTVWSSIFCPGEGVILRAEGNPSRTHFKEDKRSEILFGKQ